VDVPVDRPEPSLQLDFGQVLERFRRVHHQVHFWSGTLAGQRKDVVQPGDSQTPETAIELLPSPRYLVVTVDFTIGVHFEHNGDSPTCGRFDTVHGLPE